MARLTYTGNVKFEVGTTKDERTYYYLTPESINQRIFFGRDCVCSPDEFSSLGLDAFTIGATYNCKILCDVNVTNSGNLQIRAFLIHVIS